METIKSSAEITHLFEKGKRVNTPELILIVLKREGQHDHSGRVAFIAGKKLGNAVWRNHAKRRMREVCRLAGGPFEGYDIILIARKNTTSSDFNSLIRNMLNGLRRAGIHGNE